jgi:phage shock protein A
VTLEQLLPRTELERAFAQARSWTAIHSWRRGTLDLRSGRMVPATGIYLALARTHALTGHTREFEETLDCVCKYGDDLTAIDKQSVVRVLCNILAEFRDESGLDSLSNRPAVEKILVQSAVAMTAQIKGNTTALLDAICVIRQSAELDLISARLDRQRASEFKEAVEDSKVKLTSLGRITDGELTASAKKKFNKARYILKSLFKKAAQQPGQMIVLEMLVEVNRLLLDQHQIAQAKFAFEEILEYAHEIEETLKESPGSKEYVPVVEKDPQLRESELEEFKAREKQIRQKLIDASVEKEQNIRSRIDSADYEVKAWQMRAEMAKYRPADDLVITALRRAQNYAEKLRAHEIELFEQTQITKKLRQELIDFEKNLNMAAATAKPKEATTSTYGGNSTRELDLQLANLLADLGDRFALNELREEACECYSRSIMARIRAKNLDNATRRNLVTISSNALISKIYNPALEQFRRVNKFLEYSDDLAFYGNVRDLALYGNVRICSQSQSHLLEQLVDPDSKLDQASFSALKSLVDQNVQFSQTSFALELLPYILELLHSRVDPKFSAEILDELWKVAYDFPPTRIFSSYIQPLSIMTEQLLDSGTAKAFEHHTKIFAHLQKSVLEKEQKNLFWRVLIAIREEADGRNSPSLVPLLARLAQQYFELGDSRDCFDICERVRLMDKSDLKGINAGLVTVPQYVTAFFDLTRFYIELKQDYEANELALEIREIFVANEEFKEIRNELYFSLGNFLLTISQQTLSPPKVLFELLESMDDTELGNLMQKLENSWAARTALPLYLLNEVIRLRELSKGIRHNSLIPLLYRKARLLEETSNSIACDDTYRRIIEIESVYQGDQVLQHQMNFLQYLMRTKAYTLAFEYLREILKVSSLLPDDIQMLDIFSMIDEFVHQNMFSHSSELLVALLSKSSPIKFDFRLNNTFDAVFTNCLMSNDAENAELLLANALALRVTDEDFLVREAKRFVVSRRAVQFAIKLDTAIESLKRKRVPCLNLEKLRVQFVARCNRTDFKDTEDPPPLPPFTD